jgi:hypothetical protein
VKEHMNSFEKEYITLFKKFNGEDNWIAEEIKNIQESGGIISVTDDGADLIYTCADGDTCEINLYPRLYDALVACGDIEEVELTEAEKKDVFSKHVSLDEMFSRVRKYIEKLRVEIATGGTIID